MELLYNSRVEPSVTVFVIPAYNEGEVIFGTLNPIIAAGYKVVCIDDASSDLTSVEALRAGAIVVRHLINAGQGASLQTGFDFVSKRVDREFQGTQFIVTFDADGQHSLTDVKCFLDAFEADPELDIALGSRFLSLKFKGTRLKRIVLRTMAFISRFTLGIRLTDRHNGFRVIKMDRLKLFQIHSPGYEHADEFLHIISQNKLKYTEVATNINYTDYSLAKGQPMINGFKILFDRLINGWR